MSEPGHHVGRRDVFPRAIAALLDLDLAFGKALRSHHDLPGNADQVGGGELGAGALVGVVVEHVDALGQQLAIELFAGRIRIVGTLLQVENDSPEWRDRLRPFDARIVMAGLDDGADQARDADTIGAAMDRHFCTIGAGDKRLHLVRILGAEVEESRHRPTSIA